MYYIQYFAIFSCFRNKTFFLKTVKHLSFLPCYVQKVCQIPSFGTIHQHWSFHGTTEKAIITLNLEAVVGFFVSYFDNKYKIIYQRRFSWHFLKLLVSTKYLWKKRPRLKVITTFLDRNYSFFNKVLAENVN